ncbi:MAG: Flp pilus assembly complex ATPase component TadA [Candidatus Aenigmarchaeota archaeon]|nr:Flp pilus assembly complex ATPase component TadA [Candidatus Aenigmarchaeota archaeon]
MALQFEYNPEDNSIRLNTLGTLYGSSLEDFEAIMAAAIDKIAEVKKVSRIVLAETREYEYDWEQTRLLVEIANALDEIVRGRRLLTVTNISIPNCDRHTAERSHNLQRIVIDLMRRDPIGAYAEILREIRKVKIEAKKNPYHIQCYAHYANNALAPIQRILESTALIQMVKDNIAGYHIGDRTLYREIFHPTIRPNFMLTRFMSTTPKDGQAIDRYKVGDIEVEIYRIPTKSELVYHVIPPEFQLTEDKYMLLDAARRYMGEHKPVETEFSEPERAREIFYNIGRDMIRDLSTNMGIFLNPMEIENITKVLTRYTAGFGVLEILLADEKIQDIYINSPIGQNPIYINHSDYNECSTNLIPTKDDAESWATRFRIASGRPLDEANPVLDTDINVPGGRARVAAITKTLSPEGLAFAFRRHRDRPWTLPLFIKSGMIDPLFAGVMSFLVDGSSSMLVAGGRGSGKCLSGDTLVQLADGNIVPIKVIVDNEFKINRPMKIGNDQICLPEGIELLALNDRMKLERTKVTAVWKRPNDKKLIKIKTKKGKTVLTTQEHPYFCLSESEFSKIRADEIKPSMMIATPRYISIEDTNIDEFTISDIPDDSYINLPKKSILNKTGNLSADDEDLQAIRKIRSKVIKAKLFKKLASKNEFEFDQIEFKGRTSSKPVKLPKLNRDFMSFLGYVYGDGSIEKSGVSFHNTNCQLRKIFVDLSKKIFGLDAKEEYSNRYGKITKARIHNREIVRFLRNIGIPAGRKASILELKGRFLKLPKDLIKSFIRSYFDCDSGVSNSRREIEFSTASKAMVNQMQSLLLRFGIISSVYEKNVAIKTYYRLIVSEENAAKFNEVGYNHPEKKARLSELVDRKWKHYGYDLIPAEAMATDLVKKLRIEFTRDKRKLFRPDIYAGKKWGLSRRKLFNLIKIIEERKKELGGVENNIVEIKDFAIGYNAAKMLVKDLIECTKILGISQGDIARESGLPRGVVSSHFNQTFEDLNATKLFCNACIKLIKERANRFDGSMENFVQTDLPLSYEYMSRELGIPTTTIKHHFYAKPTLTVHRGSIQNLLTGYSEQWNNNIDQIAHKISNYENMASLIKTEAPSKELYEIIKLLNIETERIEKSTGVSISNRRYIYHTRHRPENIAKIIGFVEGVWKDANSEEAAKKIEKLKLLAESDIYWDEVKTVEQVEDKDGFVYDLTVEPSHNFVANGVIVSNTSLLNALMLEISPNKRILTVEDTIELAVDYMRKIGYNIERLKSRSVITHVETEMAADEALRTALRLGDSSLIVGEVRSSIRGNEEVFIVESGEAKRIQIKDLEGKPTEGILVPTIGPDLKFGLSRLSGFVKHPKRDKLLKIKTKTGREVTVTHDHSLFTAQNFRIAPIECRDLKVGDKIIIPSVIPYGYNDVEHIDATEMLPELRVSNAEDQIRRAIKVLGWKKSSEVCNTKDIYHYLLTTQKTNLPVNSFTSLLGCANVEPDISTIRIKSGTSNTIPAKLPINADFCRFLGYIVSDGWVGKGNVSISNNNDAIVNDVISLSNSLFGIEPYVRETLGWGVSKQIKIQSVPLATLIDKLECGKYAENKRIPPIIYGLSLEKICSFLRGLYSGDGSFTISKQSGNSIRYHTTSKKLAEDVMYLLLCLGIVARVRQQTNSRSKNPIYTVEFKKLEEVRKFLSLVGFVNKDKKPHTKSFSHSKFNSVDFDPKELEKHLKLTRKYRHLRRLKKCSLDYLRKIVEDPETDADDFIRTFVNGNFFLDEVKEIEEMVLEEPEYVYDLSVNPTQNFVGGFGGILLHNTEARALYEAMRIGALSNVVAGTIHGESPYGVYDRVVNDLGVPSTSFKATDIIVISKMLRSADGLHKFRRVTDLTEVRKHWKNDPYEEKGFVNLMEYSAAADSLKPTEILSTGESEIINRIASLTREWEGKWEDVWENIQLRANIKKSMVGYSVKFNLPEIIEAPWVTASNEQFHIISSRLKEETGYLDPKEIFSRWDKWFSSRIKEQMPRMTARVL